MYYYYYNIAVECLRIPFCNQDKTVYNDFCASYLLIILISQAVFDHLRKQLFVVRSFPVFLLQ